MLNRKIRHTFVSTKPITLDVMRNLYRYIVSLLFIAMAGCCDNPHIAPVPDDNQTNDDFKVELTNIYYDRIEGTVTPSSDVGAYICTYFLAKDLEVELERWQDDAEGLINHIVNYLSKRGDIDAYMHRGPISLNDIYYLQPETDYVLVCFGYMDGPTTALHIVPFSTTAAGGNPDELDASFEVYDISYSSARVTVTPTIGVHYYTSCAAVGELQTMAEELGSEQSAIIEMADAEIDAAASKMGCTRKEYLAKEGAHLGKYTTLYNRLNPDTDFVIYTIAVDLTTGELASKRASISAPFRTQYKEVSDAFVAFKFGECYDGTALAELDPERFSDCRGYVVVTYTVERNASAVTWYTGYFYGDLAESGCTDEDIHANLISWGWESKQDFVSQNAESGMALILYNTPFSFLALAQDEDGVYGLGTIEVLKIVGDELSSPENILKWDCY